VNGHGFTLSYQGRKYLAKPCTYFQLLALVCATDKETALDLFATVMMDGKAQAVMRPSVKITAMPKELVWTINAFGMMDILNVPKISVTQDTMVVLAMQVS
jgi:hypothetical protein